MRFIGLLIGLLLSVSLWAQKAEQERVPKLGYVLSGGGAKGLAHIGVLKVLEELDISPDYITGTSMGSIIGGLYAAGYSANELDSIVSDIDWALILGDQYNVSEIDIIERDNYKHDLFLLQFDKGKKPSLPAGLVYGHAISDELAKLTYHVAHIHNFDSLSVPYRCIGTDLISAKGITLNNMPLAKAMRSSMAIPSIFAPVEHDSLLLVDGGVINNFPVKECRNLGADIVIGVNTGFAKKVSKDKFKTITSVLMRAASFQGEESTFDQIKLVDYFIQPKLDGYGVESFTKAREIINIGERAARQPEIFHKLEALAKELKANGHVDRRRKMDRDVERNFTTIELGMVDNCKESFLSYVKDFPTSDYSKESLSELVNTMYQTNHFNKVSYEMHPDIDGYKIRIHPNQKKQGELSVSLNYSRFKAGMIIQSRMNNWLFPASTFKTRLLLSENPRFLAELIKFRGKSHQFNYLISTYIESQQLQNFSTLFDQASVSVGYLRQTKWLSKLGGAISPFNNTRIMATFNYENNRLGLRGGLDKIYEVESFNTGTTFLNGTVTYNNQDNTFFPTRGIDFFASADYIFRTVVNIPSNKMQYSDLVKNDIPRFETKVEWVIPVSNRVSLISNLHGGVYGESDVFINQFFIGGNMLSKRVRQVHLAGVTPHRYTTNRFFKVEAAVQFRLYSALFVKPELNHTRLNITDFNADNDTPSSFSTYGVTVGMNSIVGPIQFGYYYNEANKDDLIMLNIGFPF